MSAKFKCNTCGKEFSIGADGGSSNCPYCDSSDLSEKSGGISFLKPQTLKIIGIAAGAIILIIILLKVLGGCESKPPEIKDVKYKCNSDKGEASIVVIASSSKGHKLSYSFDNGKTYNKSKILNLCKTGMAGKNIWVTVKDDETGVVTGYTKAIKTEMECCEEPLPPPPPLQIIEVKYPEEVYPSRNDGTITISTSGGKLPLEYSVDGGLTTSGDSVFKNLPPASYTIQVVDADGNIVDYFQTVVIQPAIGVEPPPCPELSKIQADLKKIYREPDNDALADAFSSLFASQSINIDCSLINIPAGTKYDLFQFLQRRYVGKPGSKSVQVLDMKCNNNGKINYLKVKEIAVNN